MSYLCRNFRSEFNESASDESDSKLQSNNIFSIQKRKLFDAWDFPKKKIKLFDNLKHLMDYYCRINDDFSDKISKRNLFKRSWEDFKSGRSRFYV